MSYCNAADVQNIVRDQILFSDAIYGLSPDDENNGDIALALSGLEIDSAYYGYRTNFEIRFDNAGDLTQYRVFKQADLDGSKTMLLIGAGDTGSDLAITDIMTIRSAGWSGAALLDPSSGNPEDFIHIITNSLISTDQLNDIILDISAEMDQALREAQIIATAEGALPANLYFVLNPPVPRQIKIATAHIVSYRALNYVFDASKGITQTGRTEERDEKDYYMANKWLRIAGQSLMGWIQTYKVQQSGTAPRWTSVEPMVQRVGVVGELHGVLEQEADGDYTLPDTNVNPFGKIEALMDS